MRNWKENKEVHDVYWGSVFNRVKKEIANYDNFNDLWKVINMAELKSCAIGRSPYRVPYVAGGKKLYATLEACLKMKIDNLCSIVERNTTPTTELIVDLGSGWGRNSLYLANKLQGKHKFLACELSTSGQDCTRFLKNHYDLPVDVLSFNYYDNSTLLSYLDEGKFKEVTLFSNHSIEQIPTIGEEFFTTLLSADTPKMKFAHLEPVSWQVASRPKDTDPRYNDDLLSVLKGLEEQNMIDITNIEADYFGLKHTNVAALIEWKKMRPHIK